MKQGKVRSWTRMYHKIKLLSQYTWNPSPWTFQLDPESINWLSTEKVLCIKEKLKETKMNTSISVNIVFRISAMDKRAKESIREEISFA